jgi:replicative DNA helicase
MSPTNKSRQSLPFSEDCEKGLLCSLLLCPREVGPECGLKIRPEHFYLPAHQIIYSSITELLDAKTPVDFISLSAELADCKQLEEIGGIEYLSDIFGFVPSWENYSHYAAIVREKWQRREAICECQHVAETLFDEAEDAEKIFSRHISAMTDLMVLKGCGEIKPFKEHVWSAIEVIEKRKELKDITPSGFGIPLLDQHLGGLAPGRLHTISGGTSSGKSLLAENAVINAASQDRPVALFSLEMNATEIVERALCNVGVIPMKAINRGMFDEHQYKRLSDAALKIAPLPIYLDDRFLIDINAIISRTRELHARHKIELLVIDYVQLIECSSAGRQATREQQISEAVRKILILTKELEIATLIMSQINDGDGSLRDCKAIGFHSDIWIRMENNPDQKDGSGRILRVVKGRQIGRSENIKVICNGQFMRFTEESIRPFDNQSPL